MKRKLQCILVDDDPSIHDIFKEYLKDCEDAEITDCYQDPREFIKSNKRADLVFIDIMMPHIDGFTVAHSIKPTPVILFTGDPERFRDILNMVEPIDVFSKPISKERLLRSVKKALLALKQDRYLQEPVLFHTSEGEVNILLTDILFVKAIKNSHRYLDAYLKDGRNIILKGYTLGYIHKIARFLLQSNRAELVAPEAIAKIEQKTLIRLNCMSSNGKSLYSKLCYRFRKNFLASLSII